MKHIVIGNRHEYWLIDTYNRHIDNPCCNSFKPYYVCYCYEPNKVKHSFVFETSANWKPGEDACWIDCPFAFNINLSERCRCFESDIKCPFIRE